MASKRRVKGKAGEGAVKFDTKTMTEEQAKLLADTIRADPAVAIVQLYDVIRQMAAQQNGLDSLFVDMHGMAGRHAEILVSTIQPITEHVFVMSDALSALIKWGDGVAGELNTLRTTSARATVATRRRQAELTRNIARLRKSTAKLKRTVEETMKSIEKGETGLKKMETGTAIALKAATVIKVIQTIFGHL